MTAARKVGTVVAMAARRLSAEEFLDAALLAFRELTQATFTGRPPKEPAELDRFSRNGRAWRVFFEAARAAFEPTPERDAWVDAAARPLVGPVGQDELRARFAEDLWRWSRGEMKPGELAGTDVVATIRANAVGYDRAFLGLKTATVQRAIDSLKSYRNRHTAAAILAVDVGAFGARRNSGESEERAAKRIANASRVGQRRTKQTNGGR